MFCLNYMFSLNQKGVAPVFVLIAGFGLVAFFLLSSSAPFKDKLFAQLFPKPVSQAASEPIPVPDTTPPIVSITNPQNGATVKKNSTVLIAAKASDNVAVSKVEFYIGDSLKCLVLTPNSSGQYSCSWNVPKPARRTYSITAKAYDPSGNSAKQIINVTAR